MSCSSKCYVYMIQKGYGSIKIGVSSDPEYRLAQLQTGNHGRLHIIAKFVFDCRKVAEAFEKFLHKEFEEWHIRGEWFKKNILRNFYNRKRMFPQVFSGGPMWNYYGYDPEDIKLSGEEIKEMVADGVNAGK